MFMLKIILYLLLLNICNSCSVDSSIAPETEEGWRLIWSDEFLTEGSPDNTKWSFAGRGTPDWKCYCFDSVELSYVKDGNLVLKGIKQTKTNGSEEYQTGCINSKGKFNFKYGKIEVRAKLPEGQGSWPAIWLMPEKSVYGGWPKSGEIDIMEHLNFDSYVYQTIHNEFLINQGGKSSMTYYSKADIITDDYNVFALEWYAEKLEFFVNGIKTLTINKPQDGGYEKWPYDQEFYIILNQALGGDWPGEINDSDLPQEFLIDWVRVYQKQ